MIQPNIGSSPYGQYSLPIKTKTLPIRMNVLPIQVSVETNSMIQPLGSNPYRSQPLFGFLPLISTTRIGSYLFNQNQNLTYQDECFTYTGKR